MALTQDTPKTLEGDSDPLRVGTEYGYAVLLAKSESFVLRVGTGTSVEEVKTIATVAGTPYTSLTDAAGYTPGLYHIYTGPKGKKLVFRFKSDAVQTVKTMLAQPTVPQQGVRTSTPQYRYECSGFGRNRQCRLVPVN